MLAVQFAIYFDSKVGKLMAALSEDPKSEDRKIVELIGGPSDGLVVTVSNNAYSVSIPVYQSTGPSWYAAIYRARNAELRFYYEGKK